MSSAPHGIDDGGQELRVHPASLLIVGLPFCATTITSRTVAGRSSLLQSSLERIRRFPNIHLSITAILLCLRFWPRFFLIAISIASSWWDSYIFYLQTWPLFTKALSTGLVGAIGDILAQCVEMASSSSISREKIQQKENFKKAEANPILSDDKRTERLDYYRAAMNAVDGVFVSGPLMHLTYDMMEQYMPTLTGSCPTLNAFLQLAVDNFVLDSFFVSWAIISSGILEGYSLSREVVPQFKHDVGPAIIAGFFTNMLIAPLEYYCFRYIPLQFRVLVVNCIDMLWDAVVSLMAHRSRKERCNSSSARQKIPNPSF